MADTRTVLRCGISALLLAACGAVHAEDTNRAILLSSVIAGHHSWEEWHDYWSASIDRKVQYVDRFFGDEIRKEDNETTRLSLRVGVKVSRDNDVELDQDVDVRLSLPNLENRLQLIVDNTLDVQEPGVAGNYREAWQDSSPDAGLRYIFFENERFRFNVDGGLRFSGSVQAFGRVRGRYTVPFDIWEMRLSQRGEWYTSDGFKTLSDMTWSRSLPNHALFRSRSTLSWEEEEAGYAPGQSFTYFKVLDSKTSWRSVLRARWPETPDGGKAVYGNDYTYRRLIYSDWLFSEITPGYEFLEEKDYLFNPFISVVFELVFERDRPASAAP